MAVEFVAASSQRADLGLSLPFLNGKPGVSVMAWIRPSSLGATRSITEQAIGPPPGTSGTSRVFFNINASGTLQIGIRRTDAGGSVVHNGVVVLSVGAWAHVAATVNLAANRVRLFINGALGSSASPSYGGSNFDSTDSKNGHLAANDLGDGQFLDGLISDYRMYDRELIAEEIQSIYTARGRIAVLSGLVHRVRFAGRAPGVAATVAGEFQDSSNSQRNGTPVNSPVYRESFVSGYRRRVG